MNSSNDDDYDLYCKIDVACNSRPTLYSDIKDVPDWILSPNGKPEEGREVIDSGAGGCCPRGVPLLFLLKTRQPLV